MLAGKCFLENSSILKESLPTSWNFNIIKLINTLKPEENPTIENEEQDFLFDYTEELKIAFSSHSEEKISTVFSGSNWRDHLEV